MYRGGGTERLRRRAMAAYVATPSHEKTYLSPAPLGTSLIIHKSLASLSCGDLLSPQCKPMSSNVQGVTWVVST